jgi:hypothetical protein
MLKNNKVEDNRKENKRYRRGRIKEKRTTKMERDIRRMKQNRRGKGRR